MREKMTLVSLLIGVLLMFVSMLAVIVDWVGGMNFPAQAFIFFIGVVLAMIILFGEVG